MNMDTVKFKNCGAKIIAHRGASSLETENTCASFIAAANRSYYGIETDVHVTADGKYIICHDDDLLRVSGDGISVEGSTYDTLRSVLLFDKNGKKDRNDLRLPSLEEYIGICKKYGKHSVLELKNEMKRENVYEIIDIIESLGHADMTTFISFSFKNLEYVREKGEKYSAQFLCSRMPFREHFDDFKRLNIDCDISYSSIDEGFYAFMRSAGVKINCYTVDTPEDAERLSSLGVDFITTNTLE